MSAQTGVLSTVHHPLGSPTGPGLFRVKGLELPAYIQNIARALLRTGRAKDTSSAIQLAIGAVQRWARGQGKVSPEVRTAAAKALSEWEAARATAHSHSNMGEAIEMAGAFNSALHPRTAAGNVGGGRFAAKNSSATPASGKAPARRGAHGQAAQLRARARDLRAQARVLDVHAAGLAKAHPGAIAAAAKATKTARVKAAKKKNLPVKHKVKHAAKKHAKARPSVATQISTLRTRASTLRARASLLDLRARSIVSLASDTPAVELAAVRVPAGKPDGGQFSGQAVTFGSHDTPAQTAAAVNALGRDQRAVCRRTILEPPGWSWRDGDLLREAVTA